LKHFIFLNFLEDWTLGRYAKIFNRVKNIFIFLPTAKARKLSRIENLKRRPTKRPDWNELMKEIESVRSGNVRLRKTQSNDRSQPVLSKVKVQGQVFVWTMASEI
jgi:hypothetical protein